MRTSRNGGVKLLMLASLCALGLLTACGPGCRPKQSVPVEEAPQGSLQMPARLFRGWPKPDLVLILSAEQHGYLLPCGCSRPQVGGLERRQNFLDLLRGKGWPVAAVDLGDIPLRQGPRQLQNVQGMIKYRYSMESLRKMGYLAVGLGENEAALSLFNLLGEFALNNPAPAVLSANLHDKENLYPEQVRSHLVQAVVGSKLRVGVTSLIGPMVGAKVKPFKVELDDNRQVVPRVLQELAREKSDLNVLLYQGSLKEAKTLAGIHKEFHAILCLSDTDEPSSEPVYAGNTLIAAPGHKGRYIGVVGVWATGKAEKPYEFRYQMVALSEEFLTPEGQQARQPILQLMEQYTRELKSQNYLARYAQMKHPSQVAIPGAVPTFVGSEKCKKCHEAAYDVWKKSKHAHGYATLEQAKQPLLRQHDAECIVCHTVGFGYEGGFRGEKETPHLKDVGCESCHGPASEHVKKATDERWYSVLNPWRPTAGETVEQKSARMLRIDHFCQSCHDIDNDVKYRFADRWPPVAHPSTRE